MIISINIDSDIYKTSKEEIKFGKIQEQGNSLSWNINEYLQNPKEYKKHNHYKSNINYHIVIATKYRLPFLEWKEEFIQDKLEKLKDKYWFSISDIAIDKDHIHLIIGTEPNIPPSRIINLIKQQLAYHLLNSFEDIKNKYLWGKKSVFSPSYFISTIWEVSKLSLEEYLKHHEQ